MSAFDPREKVNRALVVGVSEYDRVLPRDPSGVPGQLEAVVHNRNRLYDVLRWKGVFGGEDAVRVSSSPRLDDFWDDLEHAVRDAEGLLLFYFAGHAVASKPGDEIHLQMRNAQIEPGDGETKLGSAKFKDVLVKLARSRAERVLVILDCCYAGNVSGSRNRIGDARRQQEILLLMSVQQNRRIPPGDHSRATPFTDQLIEVLDGAGELRLSTLYEELKRRMSEAQVRTDSGEPQTPKGDWEQGEDLLLRSDEPLEPPPPEPPPGADLVPPRPHPLRALLRRTGRLALVLAAVAAVGSAAGIVALVGDDDSRCAPPLQLRVLTDPDLEPVLTAAANAYTASQENRGGCRKSGIGVYSARVTDAVTALRERTNYWWRPTGREGDPQPQRDIGPQPDVWIPATRTDLARAAQDPDDQHSAELRVEGGPFAYSPVVLAASGTVPGQRTGRPLAAMAADLETGGTDVRRPDPESTDAALLATMGLYGDAADARAGEHRVAYAGPPARSAADLLCAASPDRRSALLVPEFTLRNDADCPWGGLQPRTALYPDDVPGLTPTFVRVTWTPADRDTEARDDAVQRFRDWLTGEQGRAKLGEYGLRSPDPGHALLGTAPRGAQTDLADQEQYTDVTAMNATLDRYRNALGPGQVLFLLDSSGSMANLWRGLSSGPGLIQQSLGGLGAKDQYGVWAVAGRGSRTHTDLLRFGSHARDTAVRALEGARRAGARGDQADPYRALRDALAFMKAQGVDSQRPRQIVYVTDDEDNDRLTGGNLEELRELARTAGTPVTMVSLVTGGCEEGRADAVVAAASEGRCLDPGDDPAASLRDEVARTGTGEG
ncbi:MULTISPECIES: substrate-binding domain-containing protein [unclassified Streptomyces]|uniref:substrate-binding domain-containing protein n=1 Tax=unclassified Streptomyces TaxID=2593676 RepID=UPI000DD5D9A0|nr:MULTISPECIES: substrate-binding domain-containing protein [unclassified Streptomyces]QZZ29599.1 VWA domain-containing protein [Streptomyces sp. ST1015]